jgi:glycosyltransferase involved in cell wall biosynthesis
LVFIGKYTITRPTKIAIIVSAPGTARAFLSNQIKTLSEEYDLALIANLQGQTDLSEWLPASVDVIDIPIYRNINLYKDIKALLLLVSFFYKTDLSIVHSVSPKAGFLAMLASWITRVPIRLHTFTGQVWATKKGIWRWFLKYLDRLISTLATTILVDSHSQRNFLLENRVITKYDSFVLGEGSISGVDIARFKSNPIALKDVRDELGILESTVVILFVGRLKKEKGVLDLAKSFSLLKGNFQDTILLFVGSDEEELKTVLEKVEGVRLLPFTKTPEHFMAAADILCLPSYREGFGSVVIEAAACGIPSIGTNIYGLSDAIVDGETGILVPAKSVSELQAAMQLLIEDKILRQKMGMAAQARVLDKFSQIYLTVQLMQFYKNLLENVYNEC